MKCVVWNMGRRDDAKAWTHLLDDLGADLALLQETTPPSFAGDQGAVIRARAYPNHPWGSAIFVRNGWAEELALPEAHRGFLVAAEVTRPGTEPLVAVSVHAKIVKGYVRPNLDEAFDALYPLRDVVVLPSSFVLLVLRLFVPSVRSSIGFEDNGLARGVLPPARGDSTTIDRDGGIRVGRGPSLERAQVQLYRAGLTAIRLVCPAPRSTATGPIGIWERSLRSCSLSRPRVCSRHRAGGHVTRSV